MDDEVLEEILYPLYLEYQSLDGDECKDFFEQIMEIVVYGVDRWRPSEVELEED